MSFKTTQRSRTRGVTLIELLIALVILAIMTFIGLPSFMTWIQNTKIRTAAETALNGLQLAKAEALRRNTQVAFVFTNTDPLPENVNTVIPINTGNNWMVRVYQPGDYTASDFIQGGQLAVGGASVNINSQRTDAAGDPYASGSSSADVDTVIFDSFGQSRQILNTGTVVTDFRWIQAKFTNPVVGACEPTGPMRCLRVVLGSGGQIKMCDPRVAAPDPRACPTP